MLSQHAALSLNADSWSSLGFEFHDVPSPRTLQSIDGKVNAFIHYFIDVQKMTTVHNLGVEICRNEGVEQFEEFGLGPLLQHLFMQHYFSVPADAKEVCKIAIEDMITHLSVLLCRAKNREITIDVFLDFLVKKYEVEKEEDLGVRCRAWAYDQVISGIDWSTMSNKIVTVSYDRNFSRILLFIMNVPDMFGTMVHLNGYVWNHGASEWVPTLIILRLNRAALCVQWSPKVGSS